MRKYSFFLLLCSVVLLYSCKQDQKRKTTDEVLKEALGDGPQMEVGSNDTTAVFELTEKFLECLHDKDLDGAIAMLHYLKDGNEIVSLPEFLEKRQRMVLGKFLGLNYTIDEVRFHKETDCQVRYSVELFEKAADDPINNMVSFFIKPVRRDGQWYLTLADTETDSTHGSEIQN